MATRTRRWPEWSRPLVLALLAGVIGWVAFVADKPVPILDWFDLAIHEAGHLLAFPLSELAMFMAGSFAQIAFPLGMAAYFGLRRRDPAAGGFCLAWAGTSAWDVSVYVADAPVQALPLVGGGEHDWAHILGHFQAVDRAADVAGSIEAVGAMLVAVGIGMALWPLGKSPRRRTEASRHAAFAPRRAVTVREPRTYPLDQAGDPWTAGQETPGLR